MNYNHITYGQQKVISLKKTEATATGRFVRETKDRKNAIKQSIRYISKKIIMSFCEGLTA